MYAALFSWTQVEHFFDIFLSKLDSPSPIFWLEENLILSNVLITGESNLDERNGQLIRGSFLKKNFLKNPYFSGIHYWRRRFDISFSSLASPYIRECAWTIAYPQIRVYNEQDWQNMKLSKNAFHLCFGLVWSLVFK